MSFPCVIFWILYHVNPISNGGWFYLQPFLAALSECQTPGCGRNVVLALTLSFTCCSIHSWARPPPGWRRRYPAGAASARPPRCSCLSTCRSWRPQVSVRNGRPRSQRPPPTFSFSLSHFNGWVFLLIRLFVSFVFFFLSDESTELQTQICNSFKSLVVQLQGEELGL